MAENVSHGDTVGAWSNGGYLRVLSELLFVRFMNNIYPQSYLQPVCCVSVALCAFGISVNCFHLCVLHFSMCLIMSRLTSSRHISEEPYLNAYSLT